MFTLHLLIQAYRRVNWKLVLFLVFEKSLLWSYSRVANLIHKEPKLFHKHSKLIKFSHDHFKLHLLLSSTSQTLWSNHPHYKKQSSLKILTLTYQTNSKRSFQLEIQLNQLAFNECQSSTSKYQVVWHMYPSTLSFVIDHSKPPQVWFCLWMQFVILDAIPVDLTKRLRI